jgi:hypothetical protein
MGSFSHIDTAAAVRDIINKAAEKKVNSLAPTPNIGRVISVNLASLTATVWFPGDDSPISVNLFANNLPQQWHDQFDDGTGTVVNTSTTGYGSLVAVETFNGKQYITEVLSGGQFGFDQRALDLSIVTQEATDINSTAPRDLIGIPNETFINCHVISSTLTDGQAINFGPFLKFDGTEAGVGSLEITATWSGSCKHYFLVTSPLEDFDHPGNAGVLDQWMRILPDSTANNSAGVGYDFDLDVCVKKTLYGNIDDFTSGFELWFRVLRRNLRIETAGGLANASAGADVYLTIRSSSIQRGRSLTGRQLFMQYVDISPPANHGYLGFHDSRALWHDSDNDGVYDDFGRVKTSGWGLSDSSQAWSVFQGSASSFLVNGTDGVCAIPAVNSIQSAVVVSTSGPAIDVTVTFWVEAIPTGADAQAAILLRRVDANNYYLAKCNFTSAGTVTASITKIVAGVTSTIGTDVTGVVTFVANTKVKLRARIKGSLINTKIWLRGLDEPEAWKRTETDTSIAQAGGQALGLSFVAVTGNTNTKPYNVHVDEFRSVTQERSTYQDANQWRPGPWRSGVLRLANDLQKTWVLDGVWNWTGSHLSWTGSIYFSGVGHHHNGLLNGRMKLSMPEVNDRVYVAGSTFYTMTGTGINLGLGDALYCAIPPEGDWQDLSQYLFIVFNDNTFDYQLPEWAVLIAVHQPGLAGQAASLRLGNGDELDNSRGATLLNGWTGSASFRRGANQTVRLQGQPNGSAKTANTIFTLPVGYRPGATVFASVSANSAYGLVLIGTNGNVDLNIGNAAYVSLDCITFMAEQ